MRTGVQKPQPIWPLFTAATLAAIFLYVFRERGEGPWMRELCVFLGSWMCITLFALLGRVIFRRKEDRSFNENPG